MVYFRKNIYIYANVSKMIRQNTNTNILENKYYSFLNGQVEPGIFPIKYN